MTEIIRYPLTLALSLKLGRGNLEKGGERIRTWTYFNIQNRLTMMNKCVKIVM